MKYLNIYFRAFPFSLNNMNEKHYHAILYTVLSSYGADIIANPESAKGRADLLLKFKDVNYIFELKYDEDRLEEFVKELRLIMDKMYEKYLGNTITYQTKLFDL